MNLFLLSQTTQLPNPGLAANPELEKCLTNRKISLEALAATQGCSIATLNRRFKRQFGVTPMRWLWDRRSHMAAELIRTEPLLPCATIAKHCGFASVAHFSRRFQKTFKISPSAFRRREIDRRDYQSDQDDLLGWSISREAW